MVPPFPGQAEIIDPAMDAPGNPPPARIRRAAPQDAARLAGFAAREFERTYSGLDDPGDVAIYIREHFTMGAMMRAIGDSNAVVLVAEAGDELCGFAHVQLEHASPEVEAAHPAELLRLYVHPGMFGTGLGAALLEAAITAAAGAGANALWLIVHHLNARARAFYAKHGFQQVGQREFHIGTATTIDPVLAISVSA